MTTAQIMVMMGIQALATGLGLYCLVLLFRNARNQTIVAFHLLAGLGGIETLIGVLHMSELADDSPVRAVGMTAAKLFGVAVVSGAIIPLVGKGRQQLTNLLLVIHVGSALSGFFAALWFAQQA